MKEEKLYRVREAAEQLDIGVETLRSYIASKRINSRSLYGTRLLSQKDIDDYKESINKGD